MEIYRGRIEADSGGNWRAFVEELPVEWTICGTAKLVDTGINGVLAQSVTTGAYFLVKGDRTIIQVDGRRAVAALGKAGRKRTLHGGKDTKVYLDVFSLAIAEKLGDGNISEGVRRALAVAARAEGESPS